MSKNPPNPPDDDEAIDALSQEDREEYERFIGLLENGDWCIGPIDNPRVGRRQLTFKPKGRGGFSGTTWNPAIVDLLVGQAKLRDQWKASPPRDEKPGPEAGAEPKPARPASNTAIAKMPMKAVDDFPLLRSIVTNAAWYSDAMNEIGFDAMMFALQVGKFDPKEAALTIAEFRDEKGGKEKFIAFVNKRLATLWEAHESGGRIFELERQLKATTGKFLLSEIARNEANKTAKEMYDLCQLLKNNMCAEDLRKVLEVKGFSNLVKEIAEPQAAALTAGA